MIPAPDVIPFDDCPVEPLEGTGLIHTFRPEYGTKLPELLKKVEETRGTDLNIDKDGNIKTRSIHEIFGEWCERSVPKLPDGTREWKDNTGTHYRLCTDGTLLVKPPKPVKVINVTFSFDTELYEKEQRQKRGEEVMNATRNFVDNFR